MYRDEFMSGYNTVNPIEPITLSITDADLSSKDAIIEKMQNRFVNMKCIEWSNYGYLHNR